MSREETDRALDYDDRPAVRGVMVGAEGPMTPDSQRNTDAVIADHANTAWGEIRDVCPLDREHATKILDSAFHRILRVVKGDSEPLKLEIMATRALLQKAAALMIRMARTKGKISDSEQFEVTLCRFCNQPMSEHGPRCLIGETVRQCKAIGVDPVRK